MLSNIIRKWINHPAFAEICALLCVNDVTRDLPFKRALLVLWLLVAGFILYLGIRPTPLPVEAPFDKLVHCMGNAMLMVLPALIYKRLTYILLWAGSLVMAGVAIELYQSTLPARVASYSDVLADSSGILLGAILGRILRMAYDRSRKLAAY